MVKPCGTCWDPGPTSSWSCAPSVSLPPYDASSQARAARARRRQPMAISTCAFPSFYMFCSYSKNISSNQLLHRFHSNTRKHELTGGSKSRKQVEIKHAISTHRTSTATFHIYCACQIRRKISQDQNALKRFHKSCDQGFNCGFWIFKRVYIHLPKRRVSPPTIRLPWQSPCPNVPPAPSTCHDHLAFFIGKMCKF